MVLNNSHGTIDSGELKRYRAFGHTFASNRPLASWLPVSLDPPDLTISFVTQPPFEWNPANTAPVYSSLRKSGDGKSILSLYLVDRCKVMRFLEVADFYLWPDRLVCCLNENAPEHLVRVFLFGNVLPFWLELKSFVTIHASVIEISGIAVAFLAHGQDGKSTFAASLLREGFSLLTDDVLPLCLRDGDYSAYPGYPVMRMWPNTFEHFFTEYEHLERVHPEFTKRYVPVGHGRFGLFCDHPCPLGQIYILQRREASDLPADLEIERVSHRDAVIELLRYSFITRLSEAVGLAGDRFGFLSGLVQKVPVRRLIYPSGYERLPQVLSTVLRDFSG